MCFGTSLRTNRSNRRSMMSSRATRLSTSIDRHSWVYPSTMVRSSTGWPMDVRADTRAMFHTSSWHFGWSLETVAHPSPAAAAPRCHRGSQASRGDPENHDSAWGRSESRLHLVRGTVPGVRAIARRHAARPERRRRPLTASVIGSLSRALWPGLSFSVVPLHSLHSQKTRSLPPSAGDARSSRLQVHVFRSPFNVPYIN